MNSIILYVLFFCGLFYFSEGKSCPEKTRPHKTRCDAFFRCHILPNKSHVWIPENCEQGLIYERILKICVLPGDDWECNLDETNKQTSDENNIYGVNILNVTGSNSPNKSASNTNIQSVVEINSDFENNDSSVMVTSGEVVESDEDLESSGDGLPEGVEAIEIETKVNDDEMMNVPMQSKVDPNLKAHLQRLTQIIDGLQDKYQNKDSPVADLRPDQLNAFLAHYNIKSEFDAINPKDKLEQISIKQTNDNSFLDHTAQLNLTFPNSTILKEHVNLDPETKVVLTSSGPKRVREHYNLASSSSSNAGYSNSQIVVNRPEGSVLFSLPQNEYDQQHDYRSEPKISEETLKTVLELSKQMLANQNFRQVIPAQNFYQPLVQPIYLPAAVSQQFTRPLSNKYEYPDNHHYNNNKKYEKPSQEESLDFSNPDRPDPGPIHKRPTTIIHNNVIPVHVTSSTTINKERDKLNSYGEPITNYDPSIQNFPPFSTDSRDKYHSNRYENNKFPSHPSQQSSYNSEEDIEYNKYDQLPIPKPSKFTPSLSNYYTPNPHLNENNVHHVIQVDNFPQEFSNNIPRPIDLNRPQSQSHVNSFTSAYPNKHQNYQHHHKNQHQHQHQQQYQQQQSQQVPRPTVEAMYQQLQNQFNNNQYFNTQTPLSLFPQNINPAMVNIRPNSYKTESMETIHNGINGLRTGSSSSSSSSNNYYDDDEDAGMESIEDDTEIYNRISANKQIVTNELTRNVDQSNQKNIVINRRKDTQLVDGSQLVNLGGNFISYDVFQNTLLPSLNGGQTIDNTNVEIITCTAGVRQPNVTDCTRYFVCSKKDGKVLSYSCPPFTGFNSQTRICDAKTYSSCNPEAVVNRYTVEENRRIQMEALKARKEAQRIRDQATQAQNLANLFQTQVGNSAIEYNKQQNVLQRPNPTSFLQRLTNNQQQLVVPPTKRTTKVKRRKYFCREGDKIPDQTSIYNYFVCFKSNGVMKGHKMTCSKGLLFCPTTSMCTLPKRCS